MKKVLHFAVFLFISINLFAQAPNKMTYQAVIRNASNNLVVNAPVKMKISILQSSASGTEVYSEFHNPTTNANGLAAIEIGGGTSPVGNIGSINWGNGTYFLKTETDPTNGTNYTISGTSQLLSVPYALHSGNGVRGVSTSGDTLFLDNGKRYIIPGIVGLDDFNTGITSHSCGATNVHNPTIPYGTMTDQEGNIYRTVKIGNQVWMAENLKTTKYRNGVLISNITDNTQWINNTTGAYCSYNNNTNNDCPYGKMYNWYAVNSANQLCPIGWHVPSDQEWNIVISNLDPNYNPTIEGGIQSNIAGGKMKSTGTEYWLSPNQSSTNLSGFSALPGGGRLNDSGSFSVLTLDGNWWSSTSGSNNTALYRYLPYSAAFVYRLEKSKSLGFSVRCVKD